MKKMSKILTVIALVALCVCLFTLCAYAEECPKGGEHNIVRDGVPVVATCSGNGSTGWYKCTKCGAWFEDAEGTSPITSSDDTVIAADPSNHVDPSTGASRISFVAGKPASCQSAGTKEHYHCSGCGKDFEDEAGETEATDLTIEKLDHKMGGEVAKVEPTCTATGMDAHYICTTCGTWFKDAEGTQETTEDALILPAAGHDWGEWQDSASNPNMEERYCTKCGEKQTRNKDLDGFDGPYDLDYVQGRSVWYRGEEPLSFQSDLIYLLNTEKKVTQNFVGVRIGNSPSYYSYTYDCLDFYSSGRYITLGKNQMNNLDAGTYYIWVYDLENPNRYTSTRVFYVVDTPSLEPINTDKHVVNSTKNLRFLASEPIVPGSVKVGGKSLLDPNYYYVSNDGLTITLSPDFLNERQPGTFTISANTKANGTKVSCPFYILSTASGGSTSPRTGDESQLGLWAAFLLLSGAAVVVLVPKIRKHRA